MYPTRGAGAAALGVAASGAQPHRIAGSRTGLTFVRLAAAGAAPMTAVLKFRPGRGSVRPDPSRGRGWRQALGSVAEPRAKPFLHLFDAHAFAPGVILDLIASDAAH